MPMMSLTTLEADRLAYETLRNPLANTHGGMK